MIGGVIVLWVVLWLMLVCIVVVMWLQDGLVLVDRFMWFFLGNGWCW